jgi:hypothetical protein
MSGAIVDTRSGKVQGIEQGPVHVFRGIPYAAPPIGARRWKAPEREEPWSDVRDATHFSAQSAQGDFALDQMMGVVPRPKSEDSLYLNVWTPGLDSAGAATLIALMDEARSRSAAVLFTEQQTQTIVGADRIASLEHGELTVAPGAETAEVTVTLRGPASRFAELTERASALGFRYVSERG